jgi:hypothetical protein
MQGWKLSVVTGIVDPVKTVDLWNSWRSRAGEEWECHAVLNGAEQASHAYIEQARVHFGLLDLTNPGTLVQTPQVLGPVPAFRRGMQSVGIPKVSRLLQDYRKDKHIVAFLHDDLRIDDPGWAEKVLDHFNIVEDCVLLGFGGAAGVGAEGMYSKPFDPMTLARHDFMSNMRDAEKHGRRVTEARRVAVLDGFSLIGRSRFMELVIEWLTTTGVIHHAYDVAFGAYARQLGLETWLLPLKCHHHGGMSAVADPKYKLWADEKHGGDQEIWTRAHKVVWDGFREELPFWVEG